MTNQKDYKLLSHIDSPADLKKLKVEQLPELCKEIRTDIIRELSVNPGHLASSLGAVELAVALHYIYDTPSDRILWDVGHQAYAHKILTGRRDAFCTNRQLGGIHPFPYPDESEYDAFIAGHASNSISAALGMAVAARLKGDQRKVVAVIGDGAMSGGLAYEGINNAAGVDNDLLIILNDNNMSIDRSVGGMKKYLLRITTSRSYNKLRYHASHRLSKWGVMSDKFRRSIIRFNNRMKSMFTHQQNMFEGMDIRYFGTADGHNVAELVRVLRNIKEMRGPKLLHVQTVKGKGFTPAEENATAWHAPGKFDTESGERLESTSSVAQPPKFQDVFGETLLELAKTNNRVVGITPAMPTGCSMNIMMREMPDRVFDVGIAEGHAVTFSAGLAKDGLMPFCNIYSSFMQRAYDNIIHDTAIMNVDMVLCIDRAGIVGEDGPTHHGAFDLAYLRPIPNLTICSPLDERELRHLMFTAQTPGKGVFAIRYPRGRGSLIDWRCPMQEVPVGKGRLLRDGQDVAVLTIGPIGVTARKAIEEAEKQAKEKGLSMSVAHYDMRFLKPIDEDILHHVGRHFKYVITMEDGVLAGGLGSAVAEFMNDNEYTPHIKRLGLPDRFVEQGSVPQLMKLVGLDSNSMVEAIMNLFKQKHGDL